jgi:hypothetical protein
MWLMGEVRIVVRTLVRVTLANVGRPDGAGGKPEMVLCVLYLKVDQSFFMSHILWLGWGFSSDRSSDSTSN